MTQLRLSLMALIAAFTLTACGGDDTASSTDSSAEAPAATEQTAPVEGGGDATQGASDAASTGSDATQGASDAASAGSDATQGASDAAQDTTQQ